MGSNLRAATFEKTQNTTIILGGTNMLKRSCLVR